MPEPGEYFEVEPHVQPIALKIRGSFSREKCLDVTVEVGDGIPVGNLYALTFIEDGMIAGTFGYKPLYSKDGVSIATFEREVVLV